MYKVEARFKGDNGDISYWENYGKRYKTSFDVMQALRDFRTHHIKTGIISITTGDNYTVNYIWEFRPVHFYL